MGTENGDGFGNGGNYLHLGGDGLPVRAGPGDSKGECIKGLTQAGDGLGGFNGDGERTSEDYGSGDLD